VTHETRRRATRPPHKAGVAQVISYRKARVSDVPEWVKLRCALWPHGSAKEHKADILLDIRDPVRECFLALDADAIVGFLEASLRSIADGCYTSPVGYIEGWFVLPSHREKGVGKKLVAAAEKWAKSKGCTEMASDAEIGNKRSIKIHKKLGYVENSRVVTFCKKMK